MLATKISFTAGIIYLLATIYFAFVSYRITRLGSELNVPKPELIRYWPILFLFVMAITSFLFWHFLKNKAKQGEKVTYGIVVSLLLLIPIIAYTILSVYPTIDLDYILKLMYYPNLFKSGL